jgi:branched-chain amino acid transport system ATP-binding protein
LKPISDEEPRRRLLEVDRLQVRYGNLVAVEEVSIQLDAGDVRCMLGPNGAGKSSILNTISGRVKPAAGSIEFDGRNTGRLSTHRVARLGVALCPQDRDMFTNLTVRENLALGGYVNRRKRNANDEDLEQVLEIFPPLRRLIKRAAGSLSGGEQQMVAIGRALMLRPKLLLLDEPSAGLAPIVVDAIFDALHKLAESDLSILIAEQNAAKAFEISSYGYVVSNGSVHREGPTAELARDEGIVAAYLGDYADV